MKRQAVSIFLCALLCAAALAGCVSPSGRSLSAQGELPTIALLTDDAAFINAVAEAAGESYTVFATDSLDEANAADAVFLYLPEPWDIADVTAPLVIYTDKPHIVIEGVSGVVVDKDAAAREAWDTLYAYPTHCTPIRTLTLVESAESTGGQIYSEMLAAGKLMDKGLYCADTAELSAYDWAAEALDSVAVGLLDTIYAENAALARAAFFALREADRNDSVEVICAGMDDEMLEYMAEDHWLMGAAIGADMRKVAAEMTKLADGLLSSGATDTVSIPPKAILSDDVAAELAELEAANAAAAEATPSDATDTNATPSDANVATADATPGNATATKAK